MAKKIVFLLLLAITATIQSGAQVYYTKNGNLSFFSKSLLEDINADNNQVISVFNIATGAIQFSLLNNAFHFPKAKMEEDFNENYIESGKFPRSTFSGSVINIGSINFDKDGSYPVIVKGDLMVHGVIKNITTQAIITINNRTIYATASFNVLVKDYQIHIPEIVSRKIAESILVKVDCKYQKK